MFQRLIRLACLCALLPSYSLATAATGDEAAIRAVIARDYERPDKPVQTTPVVVVDDYAIAGWLQGTRGGRALLQRKQGHWQILACGGDGFRTATHLHSAGIPQDKANRLAKALATAEQPLPPEILKRFASFDQAPAGQITPIKHHH